MNPPGRDGLLRDSDISVEVSRAGMPVVRVRGALDLVAAPRSRPLPRDRNAGDRARSASDDG